MTEFVKCLHHGVTYARFDQEPSFEPLNYICSNNLVLNVNDKITRFGDKKRTSFEALEGSFLRYKGVLNGELFFTANDVSLYEEEQYWYYCFSPLITDGVLFGFLMESAKGQYWDVRLDRIDKIN